MASLLKGICVVYKPAGQSFLQIRETLIQLMCRDLNNMNVRPTTRRVIIGGDTTKPMRVKVDVDYSDHPLVLGERHQVYQFSLASANRLEKDSCGVLICGINDGTKIVTKIKNANPMRFYRIKGILGYVTNNLFKSGKIVEKAKYNHVHRGIIDQLCSTMQSSHQRKMFEACGVDIQSQAAYELAAQGPLRPVDSKIPIIYSIKCIDFTPPEFTIEVVCIHEYESYFKNMIVELGHRLHSAATCTHIQCYKYGVFNLEHALLSKYWNVGDIANNIQTCQQLLNENEFMLQPQSPVLVKPDYDK